MTDKQGKPSKGQKSFCIPRPVIEALLDAKADAYTICAYLTLANYTDASGMYSTASLKAVNTSTGGNKMKGGPIPRAIQHLKEIHAFKIENVSNGKPGRHHALTQQKIDLGPILFDRDTWIQRTGEILPDGPTERGKILHILPTFGELPIDRVWFSSAIVEGFGKHKQPLKDLKNLGNVAARLLLAMYAATDMETWGGVKPVGAIRGPWESYKIVTANTVGGFCIVTAKSSGSVASIDNRISDDKEQYWQALNAMESFGFFYKSILVLNRVAIPDKFENGESYGKIPDDAEPLYELDNISRHGQKPKGEEGLGRITAQTAGELGYPVTTPGGVFDGTYAAIVRRGQGAMIVGIYRPRYRVNNSANAGVKGTWARIHENNRDYYNFIESVREANDLPPLPAPWTTERASTRLEYGEGVEALQ